MFREKKEEELGEFGIYTHLDRTMVIQEAQAFNESPLNYRKCNLILAKFLYLLYQSEPFTAKEATNIFFASGLRRMTYLLIKEIAHMAQDVIMVTSSLTQDINSKEADIAMYRGNAIRALGKASMIPSVERFFKQAIVERDASVVSAAMVTAVHAFGENREGVRRWVAEIQQALNSAASRSISQYHALGLLYLIKAGDRMALTKLVQQMNKASSNPLAICLFLRIYAQLLQQQHHGADVIDLKPFLRHSGSRGAAEMVGVEAARIICERANDVYMAGDVEYAVSALQVFIASSKPVVKFAALRVLNDLANRCPAQVATCNQEIEGLICHPNRNIATLAITALLKTGEEAGVDRLVKQIRGYVGEISDEFKVIVVDAVRVLCLKFPARYEGILDFLGSLLREGEGTFGYKQATVDAICQLLGREIPGVREAALQHLCEFIEDSEYPSLTIQILHVLGLYGPRVTQPSKLIRYVYNRLVLEDAAVRVAAIGTLTKFAIELPHLKHGIVSILKRSLTDPDDNVRDRAILGLQGMERAPALFTEAIVPDLEILEQQLLAYTTSASNGKRKLPDLTEIPSMSITEVFEQASITVMCLHIIYNSIEQWKQERLVPSAVGSPTANAAAAANNNNGSGLTDNQQQQASSQQQSQVTLVPEFKAYGTPFKSDPLALALTEPDTEYVVAVRKHIFPAHLVLEFACHNTVPSLLLSNVSVVLATPPPPGFKPLLSIPIASLPHGAARSCFVSFERPPQQVSEASFSPVLQFISQECDPDTQEALESGFQDKYVLEAFELGLPDYIQHRHLPMAAFEADWAALSQEQTQTFALPSLQSLPEAVQAISELFGLAGLAGSSQVDPTSRLHTLLLAGSLAYQGNFVVRSRMALSPHGGVNIELAIRAPSPDLIDTLMESLS